MAKLIKSDGTVIPMKSAESVVVPIVRVEEEPRPEPLVGVVVHGYITDIEQTRNALTAEIIVDIKLRVTVPDVAYPYGVYDPSKLQLGPAKILQ